jgi:hypothetical protein
MTNEREWIFGAPDAVVSVLLEPRQGQTAFGIAQLAREYGLADATVLSPGVVSATGERAKLESLDAVATVHPKATATPR